MGVDWCKMCLHSIKGILVKKVCFSPIVSWHMDQWMSSSKASKLFHPQMIWQFTSCINHVNIMCTAVNFILCALPVFITLHKNFALSLPKNYFTFHAFWQSWTPLPVFDFWSGCSACNCNWNSTFIVLFWVVWEDTYGMTIGKHKVCTPQAQMGTIKWLDA